MEVNEITEKVIGSLFKVCNTLGGGFLEKVYGNASAIEIAKTGLGVTQQLPIEVKYDGIVVGQFFADLLVSDLVLVEFKAVKLLEDVHTAQCLKLSTSHGFACLLAC